jgi:hypothetical protein
MQNVHMNVFKPHYDKRSFSFLIFELYFNEALFHHTLIYHKSFREKIKNGYVFFQSCLSYSRQRKIMKEDNQSNVVQVCSVLLQKVYEVLENLEYNPSTSIDQ